MHRWLRHTARVGLTSLRRCSSAPSQPPPAAPSQPQLSSEELDRLVAALEKDDCLLEGVVANMQPDNRRKLVVAGGALEWFGKDSVAREVERADADKDHVISPKDFDNWFACALKRKADETKAGSGAAAACNQKSSSTSSSSSSSPSQDPVPFSALVIIAIEAGLPFVGFGFLDNATMILAGDAIDHTLGFYLNCSVMASAAMGNVVSGVMGMQVHGFVEKAVEKLNLKTPVLTEEQRKGRRVFLAGHVGGTIGIMTGLTLGMIPLLFIGNDDDEKVDSVTFAKWDRDGSGYLEVSEITAGLKDLGITAAADTVESMIRGYAENGALNVTQFHSLCNDLRKHSKSSRAAA